MTNRKAALKSCKDRLEHLEKAPSHHYGKRQRQRAIELEKVKIEALRPVTREPACRSCNHYKSRSTLEGFRKNVENMPAVLMRDSVTYRNAVRFGLVTPTPHPVRFYFEDNPPEGEEEKP